MGLLGELCNGVGGSGLRIARGEIGMSAFFFSSARMLALGTILQYSSSSVKLSPSSATESRGVEPVGGATLLTWFCEATGWSLSMEQY